MYEVIARYIHCKLGYLKDSNAAAHSVDTGISYAVRLKKNQK